MMTYMSAAKISLRDDMHTTESPSSIKEYTQDSFNERVLPNGFPSQLNTKMAWYGTKLAKKLTYIYHLTDNDRLEIDYALASFYGLGLDSDRVTCETFPLPHFKHVLQAAAAIIHEGIGFFILRGLQTINYTMEDSTTIFLGIQSYVAEKRARQDEKGNMIVHITPDSVASANPQRKFHVRYSNMAVPFHTDPDADILAFQTRSTAASGGRCILSSAHTVYNELALTRPDVIQTLARPNWPFAQPYFHQRPILFHHDSKIIFHYTRGALLGTKSHPRPSTVPQVSERQREALDLIDAIAEKHRIEITLQTGDIHFVNNLALVHRRDKFEDPSGQRRHLIRMHLRNEKLGWGIPPALRPFWKEAFREDGEQKWHIDPMIEPYFPLVTMGDA